MARRARNCRFGTSVAVLFTSYMSSLTDPICDALLESLAARLPASPCYLRGDWPTRLALIERQTPDLAWICGLLHVMQETAVSDWQYEPIAAPVMQGARYGDQPVYFADLIVHHQCDFWSLENVLNSRWAINEAGSFSGYHMLKCWLEHGEPQKMQFAGQLVETGSHLHSITAVINQTADFATIDSTAWDMFVTQQPERAAQLRVIATVGPFPAPPLVIAKTAADSIKADVQQTLLNLHKTPAAKPAFEALHIARFAPVTNQTYTPIRALFSV